MKKIRFSGSSSFESCQLCGLLCDWLMPELLSQSFGGTENEVPFLLISDCAMADCRVVTLHLFDSLPCLSCYTKQIMLDRDTGRPRGFGFITYADRRGMEDAIREMHGREFGDRIISVNKAQPKMADDVDHAYRGGYSSGGRGNYGGDRPAGQDECFKCGRLGHWARDCPSAGGGRGGGGPPLPHSRYGGAGGGGDRFGGERDRFIDDRYDGGRYGDRDRFESRDVKYAGRDRYVSDRFPSGDRFASDRYGGSDRYPQNGFNKDRGYDRDAGPRGGGDRYGSGGPARNEDRSYRSRAGPYDRPSRGGGRPSSFERY